MWKIFLAVVFIAQQALGADSKFEMAKKLEAQAESFYSIDEYARALPYYMKLDSILPGNPDYTYKIGVCLYNTIDKKKSLDYFLKAKARNVSSENMNFFLARAYHFNYKYDSAIYYYQAYSNYLEKEHLHTKKSKEELARFVKNCENGKEIMMDTLDVKIENIGPNINTAFPEYAPVVSADDQTLYFTSRRDNTTGGGIDEDGKYFEDIYVCTKQSNGTWSAPVQLGPPVNTVGHDACIGLSPDGQKLFIYKSDKDSKSGDIFICEIKNGTYSAPVKLEGGVNTYNRWENSSSITTDDKVLFFTSNRRGGFGGMDIYMSRRLPNNTWSAAFNLGPAINTPYDEDSPQIHSDGKTLFFSSKGHNSIGGFDIFSAVFNE
ncbi:MAG: hypothetical protein K2Q22_02650, partial [Cytophagales bacterium]|nr:hypothetical protein [Cytophagales bacterium]